MGELTSEEMAQLRVRLADLPGFNAEGLVLRAGNGAEEGIVVYDDGRDVLVHPEDGDQDLFHWGLVQEHGEEEPHVSTADARTRDALARWLCPNWNGTTAPSLSRRGTISEGVWRVGNRDMTHTAEVRADDFRVLPDSSPYAYALALAVEARAFRAGA